MTKIYTNWKYLQTTKEMWVTKNLKIILVSVENIVEKEENAGYQHFLLFLQCFQKASFMGLFKSWDCMVKS